MRRYTYTYIRRPKSQHKLCRNEKECLKKKKKISEGTWLAGSWGEKRGDLSWVRCCCVRYTIDGRELPALCEMCFASQMKGFLFLFFFCSLYILSLFYLGLCINEESRGKKEKKRSQSQKKWMCMREREREKEETAHSPEKKDKETDRYMGSLPSIHIVWVFRPGYCSY